MSVPVILDCDPGHDDAFAILLAAGSPLADLRAITTVGGNGTLAAVTQNALKVCTLAGIRDVPVSAGAAGPLHGELHTAADIHGESGLDGPDLPDADVELDPRPAIELMADVLREADEPVMLVPTGPLTNVANLLTAAPDVRERIAGIVWMGGARGRGNRTPYAEFNAWVDPEAAEIVVASGVPFTLVGLQLTHQALATPEVVERIRGVGGAARRRRRGLARLLQLDVPRDLGLRRAAARPVRARARGRSDARDLRARVPRDRDAGPLDPRRDRRRPVRPPRARRRTRGSRSSSTSSASGRCSSPRSARSARPAR